MSDFRANYSVLELYSSGMRFVDDYSEGDAVDDYLEMHPEADRQAVEAELKREIERIDREHP